jgi:hypothetical protein
MSPSEEPLQSDSPAGGIEAADQQVTRQPSVARHLLRFWQRPAHPVTGKRIVGERRVRTNFVVFCEARTGSYNLVSRLNSCPDVVCHGEVFKLNRIELPRYHAQKVSIRQPAERNRRALAFLAELRAVNPFKSFGFKLFASHLIWAPDAVRYVLASDTRRIVLFRPPLEMYASSLRARRTGVWFQNGGDSTGDAPVRFTAESFEAFAANYNRYATMCHALAALPGTFVIHYGQTGDPAAMTALLGFVGSAASFAETTSEYRKQYRGTLAEAFENWDELQACLGALTPLAEGPPPSHPVDRPPVSRIGRDGA